MFCSDRLEWLFESRTSASARRNDVREVVELQLSSGRSFEDKVITSIGLSIT